MTLRYGSFQAGPGGGSTGAVNSVNGKTGDVLLTNDDLNAQKKTSALPVGTADIIDEVAFQQGGVSLRTAIENLPISLATRQALLGKLDASQKGTANGVAELDASGKLPVNRLPDAALGGLAYQGGWNAATNTPALTSPALRGYYWVVTTAGSTNIGGVTDWQVGDWVISNGTAWQKIDQTDVVTSVNGKQGAVVLNAADVGAQPVDATLTALAGLVAAANKLAYFTGDDQMALADFTAFARTLLSSVDAAAARTVLDAQKSDATLTALAGLPTGVDKLPYFSGTDSAAQTTLTAFARSLLAAVNAATARSVLQALGNGGDVCTGTLGAKQFDLTGAASIIKTGNEAEILGNYSVLIAAAVSAVLAGNARSIGGAWAKFDNAKPSTILASDGDKIRIYKSAAGSADPFQSNGVVYTSLDKPTPADIGAPALLGGVNAASHHTYEGMPANSPASLQQHLHLTLMSGGAVTWYKICNLPVSGEGLQGGMVFDGEYGPSTTIKHFLRVNMTSRDGCKVSGLCSGETPAMRAIRKANGTTDVYFGLGPYCNLDGFLRWQGGYGFFPDIVPLGGTWPEPGAGESMVLEVATNNFASIGGKLLTSNDQVSGTWTPTIDGVTDFTTLNATYVKTGKFVTVWAYISFIGKNVPWNNGCIKGVPFMPAAPVVPVGYIPCTVYRGKVADPDMNAYLDTTIGNIIFNRPILRNSVVFESDADYMVSVSYEAA